MKIVILSVIIMIIMTFFSLGGELAISPLPSRGWGRANSHPEKEGATHHPREGRANPRPEGPTPVFFPPLVMMMIVIFVNNYSTTQL